MGLLSATLRFLTNARALDVSIVDGSGDQITSFGGSTTQYTEGDTDATIVGTAALMEVPGDELRPVQGTVADGLLVNLGANNDVTVTGAVSVTGSVDPSRPANATLSSVASSTSSVTLLAANSARRQFIIVNDGSRALFIAFAATASTTAFTLRLGGGQEYISDMNGYTGVISGIWNAVSGDARITEITT